jgi:hypothetical protein
LEETILQLKEYTLKSYKLIQQNKSDYRFRTDKERIFCLCVSSIQILAKKNTELSNQVQILSEKIEKIENKLNINDT